jgi:hypothetical protein
LSWRYSSLMDDRAISSGPPNQPRASLLTAATAARSSRGGNRAGLSQQGETGNPKRSPLTLFFFFFFLIFSRIYTILYCVVVDISLFHQFLAFPAFYFLAAFQGGVAGGNKGRPDRLLAFLCSLDFLILTDWLSVRFSFFSSFFSCLSLYSCVRIYETDWNDGHFDPR